MKDKLQAAMSVKLKGLKTEEQPPRLVRSNAAFESYSDVESKKK